MLSIWNCSNSPRLVLVRCITSFTQILFDDGQSHKELDTNIKNLLDSTNNKHDEAENDITLKKLMKNVKSTKSKRKNERQKHLQKLTAQNSKKGEEFWFKKNKEIKQENYFKESADSVEKSSDTSDKVLGEVENPSSQNEVIMESDTPKRENFKIDTLREKLDKGTEGEERGVSRLMRALINDIDSESDNAEEKLKLLMSTMNVPLQSTNREKPIEMGIKSRLRDNRPMRRKFSLEKGEKTQLFQWTINVEKIEKNKYEHSFSEIEWQENLSNLLPEHLPQNSFEVSMLTLDKQWEYPIDNEQDMREEEHVGFEEHVFLDHFLDDFPEGSIRSFMELVITGLQQNPYLTIVEKKKRIMWFQDYLKQSDGNELKL